MITFSYTVNVSKVGRIHLATITRHWYHHQTKGQIVVWKGKFPSYIEAQQQAKRKLPQYSGKTI